MNRKRVIPIDIDRFFIPMHHITPYETYDIAVKMLCGYKKANALVILFEIFLGVFFSFNDSSHERIWLCKSASTLLLEKSKIEICYISKAHFTSSLSLAQFLPWLPTNFHVVLITILLELLDKTCNGINCRSLQQETWYCICRDGLDHQLYQDFLGSWEHVFFFFSFQALSFFHTLS